MKRPLIIAHRAMTPNAIENSPSSLAALEAIDVDLVEMDIRLSLDRRPVVMHDAFLRRTTRARGWVKLWPSFILTRIPLRDSSERVPLLDHMLASMPPGLAPALHLKDRAALRQVLSSISRHGDPGNTWLWLDSPEDVARVRAALPTIRCTLLRPTGWKDENRTMYFRDAESRGAHGVSLPWGMTTRHISDEAHDRGLLIFSRLEDSSHSNEYKTRGIDGIITDDPLQTRDQTKSG